MNSSLEKNTVTPGPRDCREKNRGSTDDDGTRRAKLEDSEEKGKDILIYSIVKH